MKSLMLVVSGVVAGVVLVIACSGGKGAGNSAHAAPSDCASWEVASFAIGSSAFPTGPSVPVNSDIVATVSEIPAGWEPFAILGSPTFLYARRCKQ
jgi:hypothetical protein